MKRRKKVTIVTDEVLVLRRPGRGLAWCPACAQSVRMLRPEEAGALAGVSSRTIYRWVEAQKVHFAETPDGGLLICLNSLVDNTPIDGCPKKVGPANSG